MVVGLLVVGGELGLLEEVEEAILAPRSALVVQIQYRPRRHSRYARSSCCCVLSLEVSVTP